LSNSTDVIIIGGVQGANLAYHLTRRGVKPILLEKRFIGAGATGRSGGLIRMHYDLRQDAQLAWVSFEYFINWAERIGGESGFTRTGFIQIVGRELEAALRENTHMHHDLGIPKMLISADDVRRMSPSFTTDDFDFAAYGPESGYADPNLTTTSLINTAKEKGARVLQDCAVTSVNVKAGKVKGVRTTQSEFHAPVVVNAAGPWAPELNAMVALDLPLTTWRHDTMLVGRPGELGPSHPTVIDFPLEMYFRPETGGLTLVGLEDDNPLGESPEGEVDHARPGFVERAIERICRRMPAMEKGYLHTAYGGYDGITPDQHPLLGEAGPEGFYLQCGMSGTGFKIAPVVGLCMAELILDGQAKTVDISIFHPERFTKGRLKKGNYENEWH
jgi:sarcosine oxidase subunit beta